MGTRKARRPCHMSHADNLFSNSGLLINCLQIQQRDLGKFWLMEAKVVTFASLTILI